MAIGFLKEVGMYLQEASPQAKALNGVLGLCMEHSSAYSLKVHILLLSWMLVRSKRTLFVESNVNP